VSKIFVQKYLYQNIHTKNYQNLIIGFQVSKMLRMLFGTQCNVKIFEQNIAASYTFFAHRDITPTS